MKLCVSLFTLFVSKYNYFIVKKNYFIVTHVLITNIINTIVSSMIQFLCYIMCPNKVISLSYCKYNC